MDPKSLFREIKRRNIYKVGVVYAITAWVIVQVASVASGTFGAPPWVMKMLITILLLGFPVALVFAWAFEITPDGIQRTAEVDTDESISHKTGRKLNYWIIGLLAGAVVLLLAERIWFAGSYAAGDAALTDAEPSVAVLPFVDISQTNDQEWFSDGLTEELLNSLARTGKFHLASRTSSFSFKTSNQPIPAIADSLNVNHILEGSVRRSGDDMRITAQLIRADDDNHLWSNTYDVSTDSVFAVQRNIADNITSALNVYLDENERREMLNFGTRNVLAYELYLRAKQASNDIHARNVGSHWNVTELSSRALEYDPEFAGAYYLHHDAYVHYLMGTAGEPGDSTLTKREALNQIRHDLDKARQYAGTGEERAYYEFQETMLSDDWSAIPTLLERQIRNPKYLLQEMGYADLFAIVLNRNEELSDLILEEAQKDPLNITLWGQLFRLRAVENDSSFYNTHLDRKRRELDIPIFMRGANLRMYLRLEDREKVREIAQTYYEHPPYDQWARSIASAARGNTAAAQSHIRSLEKDLASELRETELILAHHLAGNEETANNLARTIDRRPLGPLMLMAEIAISGRMLYFDPKSTPNLSAKMEQMGIDLETWKSFRQRHAR